MNDQDRRTSVKFMTFNVLRDGAGEGGNRREQIAAVIAKHDPDILCMLFDEDLPIGVNFSP